MLTFGCYCCLSTRPPDEFSCFLFISNEWILSVQGVFRYFYQSASGSKTAHGLASIFLLMIAVNRGVVPDTGVCTDSDVSEPPEGVRRTCFPCVRIIPSLKGTQSIE